LFLVEKRIRRRMERKDLKIKEAKKGELMRDVGHGCKSQKSVAMSH
jgi:hypothetical protein